MKLNNLSRLTALLMALMMLCMSTAVAEDAGTDIGDVTEDWLVTVADTSEIIDTLIAAGYCETCAKDVASAGLTAWPVEGYTCLYEQLDDLTPSEAYDRLIAYYNANTDEGDALYEAYINSHNNHVINAQIAGSTDYPAVICYDCSYLILQPGHEGHADDCPWYGVAYTPSITSTPDVSTPDALEGIAEGTTITLTFPATDGLTYKWQTSVNPDAESPTWTDIEGATANTYPLTLTPEALTYAYRCVATDADGNVVSTSAPLYLGGETFFAWVNSTDIYTWVTATDLAKTQTVEYILAAYAAWADGIALAEAIYVAAGDVADTYILLELLGLTTLADIDSEGNVIDVRYHITVATYADGVITALPTATN